MTSNNLGTCLVRLWFRGNNIPHQMASVWEERFKEEAAKTIPLQEVDLKICKYLLSLDVLFFWRISMIVRSALRWERIWSFSTRRGWSRSTSRWTRFLLSQRDLQERWAEVVCNKMLKFFNRRTTKSWQSERSTRLPAFTRGWNTQGKGQSLKKG